MRIMHKTRTHKKKQINVTLCTNQKMLIKNHSINKKQLQLSFVC